MKCSKIFCLFVFALSLGLALPATVAQKVRIGHLHTLAVDGQFWIAMEKGYFKEEGLEIEPMQFTSNKVKLLNQMMFSAINAMTAEMMAVADKVGIPPKLLYETITASHAGTVSNLFKELGERIVADDFSNPTFPVDLLCKDLRLAIEMAQEKSAPPLLARTIQFANEMAQAQGFGASDTAVMWKSFSRLWDRT